MKADRLAYLLRAVLALGLIALFGYLTWRSSPWLHQISWMPEWLGRWADANGNLRNLPAFAGLGCGLIWALGLRFGSALGFCLAIGLEVGQLWIPSRGFSWADIWISSAGVILASAGMWAWAEWRRRRAPGA